MEIECWSKERTRKDNLTIISSFRYSISTRYRLNLYLAPGRAIAWPGMRILPWRKIAEGGRTDSALVSSRIHHLYPHTGIHASKPPEPLVAGGVSNLCHINHDLIGSPGAVEKPQTSLRF
jgi:hypothetical protein